MGEGLGPCGPVKVLLVEDDAGLAAGLVDALGAGGDEVEWVEDGLVAQAAMLSGEYDLIVLDLQIPGRSGLRVLEHARKAGVAAPVLILTARDGVVDRVAGLEKGADDYVVKPCDLREIRARLRALLRRSGARSTDPVSWGGLRIDRRTGQVTEGDRRVLLTPAEHRLLLALLDEGGRVVSKRRLAEHLPSGDREEGTGDAVKVHIHNLRRKLGGQRIVTIRGVGYMLEEER